MIYILYTLCIYLLFILLLPKILYQMITMGKYRSNFFRRFGCGLPLIQKKDPNQEVIWMHAVSVGESKVLAKLLQLYKKQKSPPLVIISSITETGHAEVKKSLSEADYHLYLPFDFPHLAKKFVRAIQPNLMILSEGDFWYHHLLQAKKIGSKIVVINGKLSERSLKKMGWVKKWTDQVLGTVDLLCVQNKLYSQRFKELGVPDHKLHVTGNLKLDAPIQQLSDQEVHYWLERFGITSADPIIVLGSTHNPEEKQLLEQLKKVWEHVPNLKVFIVPRHPERFDAVAKFLEENQYDFVRDSALIKEKGRSPSVVLIDRMGVLTECYQLATIAVVCGSFVDHIGGHNLMEPCFYGVPVLFGPYTFAQPHLRELVEEYQAGINLPVEEFGSTVLRLLQKSSYWKSFSEQGGKLARECQGATDKTWALLQCLKKNEKKCL